MSDICVNLKSTRNVAISLNKIKSSLTMSANRISGVKRSLSCYSDNGLDTIVSNLGNINKSTLNQSLKVNKLKAALDNIATLYENCENFIRDYDVNSMDKTSESNFKLVTWKDIWKFVETTGIAGSVISTVGGAVTGSNRYVVASSATKVVEKIAKAIPKTSNASFDWKTIFGLNSTINTNTQNTFGKALSDSINKLKFSNAQTVSDKIAVGAKWAGFAFTAAATVYDNFNDTKENNTVERKVAESVGETAVKIGEGILAGAGVTAAFAAVGVSAPAVVVGAATVGVIWAVDKLFENVTEGNKNAAEFISDGVLDFGIKAGDVIGNTVEKVSGTITGWWKKAFD